MKNIIIVACCRSGHNFVANQIQSWGDYIVHNFEDCLPSDYSKRLDMHIKAGVIDMNLETHTVIVVRDLLNWWASYLKWIFQKPVPEENIQNAFSIWIAQIKEAYQDPQHITCGFLIVYDEFKNGPGIRRDLCISLGGNYSEARLNEILTAGGGSSFESGVPGQAMETGVRYKQVLAGTHAPYYTHMLSENQEALQLDAKYFIHTEDQQQIIRLLCKPTN